MTPLLEPMRNGAQRATSVERGSGAVLTSFATTIAIARAVNYVRERRRAAPAFRAVLRRLQSSLQDDDLRVHHFIPGIGILALSGGAAVLTHHDGLETWLGLPFGAGAALTCDELALMLERSNGYWASERLSLAQALIAACGAGALGGRFYVLGRRDR